MGAHTKSSAAERAVSIVLRTLHLAAVVTPWPGAAAHGLPAFWVLVALSSLSSHAPKPVRHWWPWPARR
jgi:hypothetical protein